MAVAAYLDKYFECVEYLPLELQRCVSELRCSEIESKKVVEQMQAVKSDLSRALLTGDTGQQVLLFRQLQEYFVIIRNLGNEKLDVSSHLLEMVEDYEQQLVQKQKAIDSSSTDEFYHAHRHSSGVKESSTGIEKNLTKRSSSNKRVRPTEPDEDSNSRSREPFTPSLTPGYTNGRYAKKKMKTIKKKTSSASIKPSTEDSPPTPVPAVPMPDLSSQPLDPDEPTYCLCQQVSFGEMIGCDNDDCPIEWFHFQCVNLTSKPKGKWYCPQCTQSRKNKPVK